MLRVRGYSGYVRAASPESLTFQATAASVALHACSYAPFESTRHNPVDRGMSFSLRSGGAEAISRNNK
jgi:hypothetical protein